MPKDDPLIKFERGGMDRLAPKGFGEILTRRYLPVLSLTYISSVIGISGQKAHAIDYMLHDKTPYMMALFVALWVSIPAVLWIFIKGTHLYAEYADDWYKIIAGIMIVTLFLSYLLFPEVNVYGLRIYFAATIPMLVIMYFFFVKGGLPALAAHPLTALGLTFLVYGASIGFLY